ncbi:hypothetical protein B0H12DRAFT_1301450 [Mycena haematopus]|nr:hypothetical protein B0H12DRAFT_1301450 [Mycena haematopus]
MICGDIHGQFLDLMDLFAVGGFCLTKLSGHGHVLSGDFVDRGFHSVETFLIALQSPLPERMTLIRATTSRAR